MHTLILLICCSGFFCLYNTSKKVKCSNCGSVERWLQGRPKAARLLGLGCLFLTFISLIRMDGPVMGVLHAFLMVMTAGCCIVGLAPFRLFRMNHVIVLCITAFLLESLIF